MDGKKAELIQLILDCTNESWIDYMLDWLKYKLHKK